MKVKHNTYAIDKHGKCIVASRELKEDRFTCFQCNEVVFLKPGDENRPHFCHFNKTECKGRKGGLNGGESEDHLIAKRLIRDNIEKVQIYMACSEQWCKREIDSWASCLFEKNHYAEEEVSVLDGRYRVDVAVKEVATDNLKCIIEILRTHRIGATKANDLCSLFDGKRQCVVEIDAMDILRCSISTDSVWRLRNRLPGVPCDPCYSRKESVECYKNLQLSQVPFNQRPPQPQAVAIKVTFKPKPQQIEPIPVVIKALPIIIVIEEEQEDYSSPLPCRQCSNPASRYDRKSLYSNNLCHSCNLQNNY